MKELFDAVTGRKHRSYGKPINKKNVPMDELDEYMMGEEDE